MSWRNPILAIGLAALGFGLSACGFRPVYSTMGESAPVAQELKAVEIATIPERTGQKLRNFLIDRLHGDGEVDARYRLNIGLQARETRLGIQKDATATRAQLQLTAHYTLTDLHTSQVVTQGNSRALVSYNILEAQYATLVNEEDAYDRGLDELSQEISTRLALHFVGQE